MLATGFLDEMHSLRARGDLHLELPSMRCVGYRQAWELMDRAQAMGAPLDSIVTPWKELGIAATRQLAKRQITWLRSMGDRLIVPCDAPDALAQTVGTLHTLIARSL
jgi:tRNA dimethylallyltransferase